MTPPLPPLAPRTGQSWREPPLAPSIPSDAPAPPLPYEADSCSSARSAARPSGREVCLHRVQRRHLRAEGNKQSWPPPKMQRLIEQEKALGGRESGLEGAGVKHRRGPRVIPRIHVYIGMRVKAAWPPPAGRTMEPQGGSPLHLSQLPSTSDWGGWAPLPAAGAARTT